jgi:Flp pilus assembly protein TadD
VHAHAALLGAAAPAEVAAIGGETAVATALALAPGPATATAPAPAVLAAPTLASPSLTLRDARAAARARPSDPRALDTWAHAALRAGDLREARRAASAWALHDGTVEPRLLMAEVLDASGRRVDAKAVLAEWLETHPDASEARAALARLASPGAPGDGMAGAREIAHR